MKPKKEKQPETPPKKIMVHTQEYATPVCVF